MPVLFFNLNKKQYGHRNGAHIHAHVGCSRSRPRRACPESMLFFKNFIENEQILSRMYDCPDSMLFFKNPIENETLLSRRYDCPESMLRISRARRDETSCAGTRRDDTRRDQTCCTIYCARTNLHIGVWMPDGCVSPCPCRSLKPIEIH